MNPNRHQNSDTNHVAASTASPRSVPERGMHATNARPPPAVSYRRYPSLSDDGQPCFPRLRRFRRSADETATVAPATRTDSSPFLSVRALALAAIIVIVVLLAATA